MKIRFFSMFECETLAHRICFMNKGKLEQSGTSQELKIKYRTGYLLTFTLEHPNQTNCQMLNKIVTREFNVRVFESFKWSCA